MPVLRRNLFACRYMVPILTNASHIPNLISLTWTSCPDSMSTRTPNGKQRNQKHGSMISVFCFFASILSTFQQYHDKKKKNLSINNHQSRAHQSLASSEVLKGPAGSFQGAVFLGHTQEWQVGLHGCGVEQPVQPSWRLINDERSSLIE